MRECLTGAGLLCMDTLSCIHGHTFLHSWTHFLAFMDTLSCIHGHTFLHSWTHFLAFMEWADDIGFRPAAWSYVAVQSYSCSLRVFYITLVVGKDTYLTPLMIINNIYIYNFSYMCIYICVCIIQK